LGSKLPAGVGRGIATHFSFDSYVAQVVEASVEKNGAVRVHRVICGCRLRTVINPDTVKAQMEGGIIFGLTAALKQRSTLKDGRVQQEISRITRCCGSSNHRKSKCISAKQREPHREWANRVCLRSPGTSERHLRGDRQTHSQAANSRK